MVRIIIFSSIFLLSGVALSQEIYIQPGLLKSTGTISPSTMLNRGVQNYYLSGFLEYYVDKKLSFRGDLMYFMDGKSKTGTDNLFFKEGFRTYFGVFYHTGKKNWDNYVGIEPGIAVFKPLASIDPNARLQASPSFAVHIGSTYYIWKFFNFFVDVAYVNSTYRGLSFGSEKTDELILSAGLGFNLQTRKKK